MTCANTPALQSQVLRLTRTDKKYVLFASWCCSGLRFTNISVDNAPNAVAVCRCNSMSLTKPEDWGKDEDDEEEDA